MPPPAPLPSIREASCVVRQYCRKRSVFVESHRRIRSVTLCISEGYGLGTPLDYPSCNARIVFAASPEPIGGHHETPACDDSCRASVERLRSRHVLHRDRSGRGRRHRGRNGPGRRPQHRIDTRRRRSGRLDRLGDRQLRRPAGQRSRCLLRNRGTSNRLRGPRSIGVHRCAAVPGDGSGPLEAQPSASPTSASAENLRAAARPSPPVCRPEEQPSPGCPPPPSGSAPGASTSPVKA